MSRIARFESRTASDSCDLIENPLTSYKKKGKPRNSKIPPNIPKRDSPKYPFKYPQNTKKIRNRIFGVFSCCRGNLDVGGYF